MHTLHNDGLSTARTSAKTTETAEISSSRLHLDKRLLEEKLLALGVEQRRASQDLYTYRPQILRKSREILARDRRQHTPLPQRLCDIRVERALKIEKLSETVEFDRRIKECREKARTDLEESAKRRTRVGLRLCYDPKKVKSDVYSDGRLRKMLVTGVHEDELEGRHIPAINRNSRRIAESVLPDLAIRGRSQGER